MAFRWYANQKNPAGEFLIPSNYNRGGGILQVFQLFFTNLIPFYII